MAKAKTNGFRVLRWVFWVLLVQLILINISAALYAHRLTHFYQDKKLRKPVSTQNIFVKTWRLFTGPRFQKSAISEYPHFSFDTVKLKTQKGLTIDGWYGKTDSAEKGTVILFHGVTASKENLLAEAYDFRLSGYNILMVDFRGHGNSEGSTTTIGAREYEEVKLAYDFVLAKGEKNIFLYGISMGAVAVLKAVAEYDLHPSGAILEMPFLSMQKHMQARARLLGFGGFPEKPFGFLVTGWVSIEKGVNAYRYRASDYAKKVSCPVLLQWGAEDNIVLRNEIDKVFDALGSAHKKKVIYDHAGHESLLQKEPGKWRMEVEAFLQNNNR